MEVVILKDAIYLSSRRSPLQIAASAIKATKICRAACTRQRRGGDVVILAWDMNTPVGWLSSNNALLGGPFGFDSHGSENTNPVLGLSIVSRQCELHTFQSPICFAASALFELYARLPVVLEHSWTPMTLLCTKLCMCLGGCCNRTLHRRLDRDKPFDPIRL